MQKILLLFLCLSSVAHARWAEISEAPYSMQNIEVYNKVKPSGASDIQYQHTIVIKKESARTQQGLYRFRYNPAAESVDHIEAWTMNGDKKFVVKKSDIEIKPLAHSGPGYDTLNQVSIAYPNVEINSKLELRYHMAHKVPSVPGYYSEHFTVGQNMLVENYHETWDAEMPIYSEIYDHDSVLDVKTSPKKIEVSLKKPVYRQVLEEKDILSDPGTLVWVGISSIKDWNQFPQKTIKAYEDVINSALPEKFEKIYSGAVPIKDQIEQINYVTSNLAETLRYLGDWRLVKGAYHPHTLKQISDSGYGDCKDMSVSAGSILRKLGYTVHAVFINRTNEHVDSPIALPVARYNHAIIHIEKDGKSYWVDPTNFTSSVQRIYSDIDDRDAVVLDPQGAAKRFTDKINADSKIFKIDLSFNFVNESQIKGEGQIQLLGNASESMTGAALSSSKNKTDYRLITWATKIPNLTEWKFDNYDLTSRIVKDFSTKFTYGADWQPLNTSVGKGYVVSAIPTVSVMNIPLKERASALYVSDPHEYYRTLRFKAPNLARNQNLKCDADTKWFSYKRDLAKESDSLVLKDYFELRVTKVSLDELKSNDFKNAQKSLLTCMGDFVLVFD
ncbi:MAG: DUF3857 domain-containing protein [Pseudobdellovibrio sp.]